VKRAILLWWGVLVALWALLAAARQLQGLLTQVVLALFLSFAMDPMVDWLNRRGVKRGAATALTMVAVLGLFIAFLTAMGSLIATQLQQLADDLPDYVTSVDHFLEKRFGVEIDNADLMDQLRAGGAASDYLSGLADNLVGVGTSLLNVVFELLTISLFAFYFTADGHRLRRAICSVLPPARQLEVLRIWELGINKTGAFISSRVILAIISAAFHWVVFAALDLPSSLALALWVGLISQFIPVIGIYIAGVIPALIALGIEPTKALWVLVAVVIYQQVENYGLQPRITAQTLNMHPAVAFAAVLAGTATFGVSGALLALPFLATVQSFISVYIARHTVVENRLLGQHDTVSEEEIRRMAAGHRPGPTASEDTTAHTADGPGGSPDDAPPADDPSEGDATSADGSADTAPSGTPVDDHKE
jgi:predicted PurR-regulated permease PerM